MPETIPPSTNELTEDERELLATVIASTHCTCGSIYCATNLAEKMDQTFPDEGWYDRVMGKLVP